MTSELSFAALMAKLRAGDEEAASQIFHRFASRLIALARSRLDARMRQKVDPEDVLQSVFRTFFIRQAGGQFALADWDGLWSMLAVITLRKCGHRIEHFRAERRDVQREVANPAKADESAADWEGLARDPTPYEAAQLADTVEQLLRDLDERDRSILELRLQGETLADISAQVGCTERTVQRVLDRVRRRLDQMRTGDEEAR